jgi:regulator of RNase E activity RraA
MEVLPGNLLHGDRHGVQTVPLEIAEKIPRVAHQMIQQEQELIRLSHSEGFGLEELNAAVAALRAQRKASNS